MKQPNDMTDRPELAAQRGVCRNALDDFKRAGLRPNEPGEEAEEARLTGAIRPGHSEELACSQAEGDARENESAAALAGEVRRLDGKRGEGGGVHSQTYA